MSKTQDLKQILKSAKHKGLISSEKAQPIMEPPNKKTSKDPDHPHIQTLNGIVTALTILLILLLIFSGIIYLRNQVPYTSLIK